MLAYKAHPAITRDAFLAELQSHQDQDRIVQGQYDATSGKWRGCAVGCSLHSVKKIAGIKGGFSFSDHSQYPLYLGIPQWLARLQDHIFEKLPATHFAAWPMRFSAAIQSGADLENIWAKIAPHILREVVLPTIQPEFDYIRVVVARVAVGWETGWINDDRSAAGSAARSAAWSAARSAAWSAARSAAWSAAWSAARSAAWSAAWSAARSAAESAGSAAGSAAESAAYVTMSNIVCQELARAPLVIAP